MSAATSGRRQTLEKGLPLCQWCRILSRFFWLVAADRSSHKQTLEKWLPEGNLSCSDSYEKTCGAPGFSSGNYLLRQCWYSAIRWPKLMFNKGSASVSVASQCTHDCIHLLLAIYLWTRHISYSRDTKQIMASAHESKRPFGSTTIKMPQNINKHTKVWDTKKPTCEFSNRKRN